jgi:hypothetical protein
MQYSIHGWQDFKLKYHSTWAALTILYQIINLIHNLWFSNYFFNFEIFNICVIYVIKFISIFKIFHYISGHMDVK